MIERHGPRVAWCVGSLVLVMSIGNAVLHLLDWPLSGRAEYGFPGSGILIGLGYAAAGVVIGSRHPRNAVGWLFVSGGFASALQSLAQQYAIRALLVAPGSLPGGILAAWLGSWVNVISLPMLYVFLPLLFPDGHLPSPRWRLPARLMVVLAIVAVIPAALPLPGPSSTVGADGTLSVAIANDAVFGNAAALLFIGLVGCAVAAVSSLIVRFRRARGDERQQLKWFLAAASVDAVGFAGIALASLAPTSAAGALGPPFSVLAGLALPAATGVAILRHRLYDIDVVINRTIVYGSLAGFITAVYIAIVVGIGSAIGSGGKPNLALSILATAVVSVAFHPVRERVQNLANRLVYGRRSTPYQTLSLFSEHVAEAYDADQVLQRMARILAEATRATTTRVWLRSGRVLTVAATWPADAAPSEPIALDSEGLPSIPESDRATPVRHQGELLGALTMAKRHGETLTPIEDQLLTDLATQAGIVLKNARLTAELLKRLEELRASRQRLVAAQDAERRRLERNLHDGAQQSMVALKVKLGLAEMLIDRDPGRVQGLLADIGAETDQAMETLRDLARGLYPPLLADKGLVAALEAESSKSPLPVQIESGGLDRYPQDTEAAVYFCCLEAVQNALKYARATRVQVRLAAAAGALTFVVEDDGTGFDPATTRPGSGLQNMRDRLDALGGDMEISSAPGSRTTLRGRVPIQVPVVAS